MDEGRAFRDPNSRLSRAGPHFRQRERAGGTSRQSSSGREQAFADAALIGLGRTLDHVLEFIVVGGRMLMIS